LYWSAIELHIKNNLSKFEKQVVQQQLFLSNLFSSLLVDN